MLGAVVNFLVYAYALLHPHARTLVLPKGFHVAFTENPGEIVVMWLTYFPQWQASFQYKAVNCGPESKDWKTLQPVVAWTRRGFVTNGHIVNSALMSNLHSECRYEYAAGFGLIWAQAKSLQGHRFPPDLALQTSVVVIGDMGSAQHSAATRGLLSDMMGEMPIQAVLHSGDIAYNLRDPRPSFVRRYFTEVEFFASTIPYMVAPGNHERQYNFTRYRELFRMPNNTVNEGSSLFYSFDLGLVHFVIYCAEYLFYDYPESEQTHKNWLIADLHSANENRNAVPWIVLIGHRPLYCGINWFLPLVERFRFQSNFDCSFRATIVRNYMEDIIKEAEVDLVISSHVHNYERFAPIYHNSTVPSEADDLHYHQNPYAPVYIVNGAAGNVEGNDAISPTPDPWRRFGSAELGLGRLTAENGTHLYWEQWTAERKERLDYVWIERTRRKYEEKQPTSTQFLS